MCALFCLQRRAACGAASDWHRWWRRLRRLEEASQSTHYNFWHGCCSQEVRPGQRACSPRPLPRPLGDRSEPSHRVPSVGAWAPLSRGRIGGTQGYEDQLVVVLGLALLILLAVSAASCSALAQGQASAPTATSVAMATAHLWWKRLRRPPPCCPQYAQAVETATPGRR